MIDCILHLSLINGIGPAAIDRIMQNLSAQQICDIYAFKHADFVALCGFTNTVASKLVVGLSDKTILDREKALLQKHEITLFTLFDSGYPSLLKQIYLPPPVLYCKGLLDESKTIAVVGSRQAQGYAQRTINLLVPPLVTNGWTIVSGGAVGADTFAHQTTINARGKTVVVLGSGLLRLYPTENRKLFDAVVNAGGALITPFALEQQPLPGNFPARNRIIAGLSQGCLVVQAAQKSGARITATYALEQGKDVFVVPGPIDDPLSAGGHSLIQQGAKLVASAEDIVSEFNETIVSSPAFLPSHKAVEVVKKECLSDPFLMLCANPISLEELAHKTNLSFFELQVKLFDLQLEGKISQNFAGFWQSCL